MTAIALTDRTEMAERHEPSLDDLFERLERMPVPEGCKTEIVEGTVFMSPLRAYALAGVPVFLIADPYAAECHVLTHPGDGACKSEPTVAFGEKIDLTGTVAGLVLETGDFPTEA